MASFASRVRSWFNNKVNGPFQTVSVTRPHDAESLEDDHNDFALALFERLRSRDRNLFLSPFSIRIALAMAYAGAKGETAVQMRRALRFGSSDDTLHSHLSGLLRRLNAAPADKCTLAIANSLWSQDGLPVRPEFVERVARHYGGGLNVVDFRQQPETARVQINRWVEQETRGRIQDLLSGGSVNTATRLVLANAVYFKGTWVLRFPKAATREEPFQVEGGGTVTAPLMYQREEFRYLQDRGFQAVDLDFEGGAVSMMVLLPDKKDGIQKLESRLTAEMFRDCVPRMFTYDVHLFLPRFRMTWGTRDVAAELQALGMRLPFDPVHADFSGISGHTPPHEDSVNLSAVFHQAGVEVNEEGAEAAAATALTGLCTGAGPREVTFRADHPFLFAIRDTTSGAILFLGRVADPQAEAG